MTPDIIKVLLFQCCVELSSPATHFRPYTFSHIGECLIWRALRYNVFAVVVLNPNINLKTAQYQYSIFHSIFLTESIFSFKLLSYGGITAFSLSTNDLNKLIFSNPLTEIKSFQLHQIGKRYPQTCYNVHRQHEGGTKRWGRVLDKG